MIHRYSWDQDVSGAEDPKWLSTELWVWWILGWGCLGVAYYWFDWWGLGLCVVAEAVSGFATAADARRMLFERQHATKPPQFPLGDHQLQNPQMDPFDSEAERAKSGSTGLASTSCSIVRDVNAASAGLGRRMSRSSKHSGDKTHGTDRRDFSSAADSYAAK